MKKVLSILLIVVTIFAFCSCGNNLEGSYSTAGLITFEFHQDGVFYVATSTSAVQKGSYEATDQKNTYKLKIGDVELGTCKYNKDSDSVSIEIGGSALEYNKIEDAGLKDKYKAPEVAE